MPVSTLIEEIADRLTQVAGVTAVVLGGSRAKGNHTDQSDIDIGIYYEPAGGLDMEALRTVASAIDDRHRKDLITGLGEWGPWVNGGGWLTVRDYPVDFLFRDLNKVRDVLDDCLRGHITIDYYPGHPHGFVNSIYMAEIASCLILSDPHGTISELKRKTETYSPVYKRAVRDKFLWEASFSVSVARKSISRQDVYYAAGCAFRAISCLNQVLFALNEQYGMNEKGAVDIADAFPAAPRRYKEKVSLIFGLLSHEPHKLQEAVDRLQDLIEETEKIAP